MSGQVELEQEKDEKEKNEREYERELGNNLYRGQFFSLSSILFRLIYRLVLSINAYILSINITVWMQ